MRLGVLRHAGFARLWTAQALSLAGDGIYFVAIAWLVLDDHGPGALGVVILCWTLGNLAALTPAGLLADRRPRRNVLIFADLVRAAALLGMAIACWNEVHLVPLAALSVVQGIGDALFAPSFLGTVAALVPKQDVVRANALEQVARPLCYRLLGPAVGGLLISVWSAPGALLIDAGTFVVCAIVMAGLPPLDPPPVEEHEPDAGREWRAGLAYVRARPWLWSGMVAGLVSNLVLWGTVEVLLPVRLHDDLGAQATDYGLLLGANGVGGLLGAWILTSRLADRPAGLAAATGAWSLAAFAVAGYGVPEASWQLLPLAGLYGFGMAVGGALWTSCLQQRVPEGMLGRVGALDTTASNLLTPVSLLGAGPAAAFFGAGPALLIAGSVMLAGLLVPAMAVLTGAERGARPTTGEHDDGGQRPLAAPRAGAEPGAELTGLAQHQALDVPAGRDPDERL
ncbi:hypothetical protein DSM112329_04684 [Paraconexibacter sp. AEG42_29]|uniref:MFS transporter n=1 Tax=Paraconexibacter sp. AEG42_29 TaxID=2997339 RepID=A0AAU7B1G5_9ACTN